MKLNFRNMIWIACALSVVSCTKETDWYNAETTVPFAGINDTELVLDGKAESAMIRMESNMWWTAEVLCDDAGQWCSIAPDSGYGNVEIAVTAARNYDALADRTARIVIKGDDRNTGFIKEFIVIQKSSSPYIDIDNLRESLLEVPIVRSVNALLVKSNNSWTAVSNVDWCTVETDGEAGESVLSLVCATNTSGSPREAVVEIRSVSNPDVMNSFLVRQGDEFGTTVVTVDKTSSMFSVSWEPVVGAACYHLLVRKSDGEVVVIDAGAETSFNLSSHPLFAVPEYAGYVAVSVMAVSEDPSVFSVSEEVESNSHFTSGMGTYESPFIIGDIEEFRNISIANKVLDGAVYRLSFQPSLGDDFVPICSVSDPFTGVFDGNGVTISDWRPVVCADKVNCYALFGAVASGGKVSNLKFRSCELHLTKGDGSVSGTDNGMAFVAGINAGEISGVEILNCIISTDAGTSPLYVGAVAGQNSGTIHDCNTSGGRISAAADRNKSDEFNCGGIAGYNMADGIIGNCINGNEIMAMNIVGGIAGYNDGAVINCGNTGKITADYYFGGIAGYVKTTGKATFRIENCYNTGTLVMDEPANMGRGAAYMGGITSRIHSTGIAISGCWCSGEIIVGASVSSSNMRVGGIVGHVNNTGAIEDCYFEGKVTVAGKVNYGGIVGEFADKATRIVNCYSTGKVTLTDSASGNVNDAFGSVAKSCVISSCYALNDGGGAFAGGTMTGMGAECGYRTEAEMKIQDTFAGYDFNTVWEMDGYPRLRNNPRR